MGPPNAHALIPNSVIMLSYMVKETLQNWINEGFRDGEITLDYLCGPNVITRVRIRRKQEEEC